MIIKGECLPESDQKKISVSYAFAYFLIEMKRDEVELKPFKNIR